MSLQRLASLPKNLSTADFFESIFENASDAIYVLDKYGNFLAANHRAEELTGFNREDFLGKSFTKIIPVGSLPKAIKGFTQVLQGTSIKIELVLKTSTKKTIPVEITSTPLTINGRIVGTHGIVRDISERKTIRQKLEESEEQYRTLCEDARALMLKSDLKGNITFVNRIVEDYGLHKKDILGKNMAYFIPKRYLPKLLKTLWQVTRGKNVDDEIVINTPKGEIVVEYRSGPIREEEKIVGTLTIIRDITEKKKMEKKIEEYSEQLEEKVEERTRDLRKSEEKLRSIFSSSPDAITVTNLKGNITQCNQATLKMHGYSSKDEVVGKSSLLFITEKDHARALKNLKKALKHDSVKNEEYSFLTKDGREFPAELSASVIKDDSGQPIGFVAITKDITERTQAHQQLVRYSHHLEELVEERTRKLQKAKRMATIGEVAAMVGHDLRNPLQGILNTLYLVSGDLMSLPSHLKEKHSLEELLGTVEEQVEYMDKIVSDLQDYARPLKLELTDTNIKQLIESTLSTVNAPENVHFSVSVEEDFPSLVVDPKMMRRVFINLFTNAFQAMPKGGQLRISGARTDEAFFIKVQDTGTGISKENLPMLFRPLFTTKAKGQGFGLAVCKRIVEAHNGSITVESKEGRGSTFTIIIPRQGS